MKLVLGLFGLENFYGGDISSYIEISQMGEELGFDSVSVTDHVVMGKNLHKYPFGKFPLPSEAPWFEPLSLLTMIASNTSKINLATAILIAPLRNPALLAKTVATLDTISKGRLELGVGLGWQKEEFDAAGVSFEDRSEIFWETLEHLHTVHPWALEILAFPFDHPGSNSIEKCKEEVEAAEKKGGHKIHIMEPIDINGPNTNSVFISRVDPKLRLGINPISKEFPKR